MLFFLVLLVVQYVVYFIFLFLKMSLVLFLKCLYLFYLGICIRCNVSQFL
jgi:hypothetical protein